VASAVQALAWQLFRNREIAPKDRRLRSEIVPLDAVLDGGIARRRVSEIVGCSGAGRTALAAAFVAVATRRGEVVAWIDGAGAFDPASIVAAGVDLSRLLWISARDGNPLRRNAATPFERRRLAILKAAELVLDAGGFGVVVIDFGNLKYPIPQSAALRLARAAGRSGAAVIVIASRRMCGTFAALSLAIEHARPLFSRLVPGSPAIFAGLKLQATVTRNKLGGIGASAIIRAMVDPIGRCATQPIATVNRQAAAGHS